MDNTTTIAPDSAAILAAAMSLYGLNTLTDCETSDAFEGHDNFMRVCMKLASDFEIWACANVEFAELTYSWVYLLSDHFLAAVQEVVGDLTRGNVRALADVNPGHFPAIDRALRGKQG